jgi:hypothetical protein
MVKILEFFLGRQETETQEEIFNNEFFSLDYNEIMQYIDSIPNDYSGNVTINNKHFYATPSSFAIFQWGAWHELNTLEMATEVAFFVASFSA